MITTCVTLILFINNMCVFRCKFRVYFALPFIMVEVDNLDANLYSYFKLFFVMA
jgi:hypothetical protein